MHNNFHTAALQLSCLHVTCYVIGHSRLSRFAALHRKAEQVAFTPGCSAALCCSISNPCCNLSCAQAHQSTPWHASVSLCLTLSHTCRCCASLSVCLTWSHVQVPVYAHVKEVVDPQGNLEAVEINYMKFLAFNGSYKVCAVMCHAVMCCAVLLCLKACCAFSAAHVTVV